jgi:hypothetical protein
MTSKNRSSWKSWRKASAALNTAAMQDELVADFGIASLQVSAIAFVILILSGFSAFATVHDSDGSEASVRALLNAAHDGDTITLPAGTFSWTSRLEITKGITLQGATTINGAGTSNPAITDATIIRDDTPRRGSGTGIITVEIRSNQSFRLTGITFSPGSSTAVASGDGAIHLLSHDSAPCTSVRVDHCHFNLLYQGKIIWVSGWVYGVADHNVFQPRRAGSFPFNIWHDGYGNKKWGNGAWEDYPGFGTEKFFFIEDNTVERSAGTAVLNSFVDTLYGGKWVARHNYLKRSIFQSHGTEGGAARGQRAAEAYDNVLDEDIAWSGAGQRSGTSLFHDNLVVGTKPQKNKICKLANYRETPARPKSVWGIADGTSPWDANDTEGNGTFVEGHPPFVFDSGTATGASVINGGQGTFTDSSKNWTPNKWVGYSIKNPNLSSAYGSFIISNTANAITYSYYAASDAATHLIFNVGDTYQIHRVLVMMDQNGRGKTDPIENDRFGNPHLKKTGQPGYAHPALEPCYSWNNKHTDGTVLDYHSGDAQPTTKEGKDYFNLGGGFPANTTPAQVSSTYTAALNGVDYTGTFIYPHPLVSGGGGSPTPTPSAARGFPRHLEKKKKTNAKRVKKKKRNQAWIRGSLKRDRE